jgi:hypothetical protein
MNKKQFTEEELKELMEAPPTEEEMEMVYKILSHIPKEYLDSTDWN